MNWSRTTKKAERYEIYMYLWTCEINLFLKKIMRRMVTWKLLTRPSHCDNIRRCACFYKVGIAPVVIIMGNWRTQGSMQGPSFVCKKITCFYRTTGETILVLVLEGFPNGHFRIDRFWVWITCIDLFLWILKVQDGEFLCTPAFLNHTPLRFSSRSSLLRRIKIWVYLYM